MAATGYLNLPESLLIFCKVGYFVVEFILFNIGGDSFFSQLNVVLGDMLQPTSTVSLQYET